MGRKRLDKSYFILECMRVHGGLYNYDKTDFVTTKTNIVVTCPIHGDFEIRASNHLQGFGCSACSRKRASAKQSHTKESFCQAAMLKQKSNISYEKLVYVNLTTKAKFTCSIHGDFLTTPSVILAGKGCASCAKDKMGATLAGFVSKSKKLHGGLYDYSEVKYVNGSSDVNINCSKHGLFAQTPESHLQGRGCPSCASGGFKRNQSGTIYILVSEELTKIGISNKSAKVRLKGTELVSKGFKVYAEYFLDSGYKVAEIENKILTNLKSNYSSPLVYFPGHTECFYNLCPKELNQMIIEEVFK